MPQRCPGKRRASVARISHQDDEKPGLASGLRLLSFHVVLVVALSGCSVTELEKFALEGDELRTAAETSRDTGLSQKVGVELLSPESIIYGGRRSYKGFSGQLNRLLIGEADEIKLVEPVAVGGVDQLLYIVDAGSKIVYKYDLVINEIEPIQDISTHFTGPPGNIYVAKDHSFYVVDSVGKQVLHFDGQGNLLTRFQDLANLSRPMDVIVDEKSGEVMVADGSYSHIVVFNRHGNAMRAIGRRGAGPGRFRTITFMTAGKDGLYILDSLELPVQVLTWEGDFRYSFGESELVYPNAIVVDRDQRVFISDRSDNTIKVYQNGQLLLTFGGGGSAPGRFRFITGLWVSGNLLYVADSMNRRVQVLRINPSAPVAVSPVN